MKKYNIYWDSVYKFYYYSDDSNLNNQEISEKTKKNEPIKKFNVANKIGIIALGVLILVFLVYSAGIILG